MTDRMVSSNDPPRAERVEVITSVQRRRHWTTQEKVRLVEETYLPGQSVSLGSCPSMRWKFGVELERPSVRRPEVELL